LQTRKWILIQAEPKIDENILKKFGHVFYNKKDDSLIVETDKDCRLEISKFLFEKGYIVKELHLEEI
ncbi:MAG: hypothetical protein QXM06_06310, partial [Archaeoglobaceae archaeon]